MPRQLRAAAICLGVLVLVCGILGYVLPWISEAGCAGEVIQHGFRNNRDATPLFYTESERSWEILRRFQSRAGGEEGSP